MGVPLHTPKVWGLIGLQVHVLLGCKDLCPPSRVPSPLLPSPCQSRNNRTNSDDSNYSSSYPSRTRSTKGNNAEAFPNQCNHELAFVIFLGNLIVHHPETCSIPVYYIRNPYKTYVYVHTPYKALYLGLDEGPPLCCLRL